MYTLYILIMILFLIILFSIFTLDNKCQRLYQEIKRINDLIGM